MLNRPNLYFRRKDNGAAVYRVGADDGSRLDLTQIAILKQNGDIKPQGKHQPTEDETQEIAAWHAAFKSAKSTREAARVDNLISDMNGVTQWIQANATDKQIDQSAQSILMAIHDLRTTLVRRLGGRQR